MKRTFLLIAFVAASCALYAQSLTGFVTDASSGQPIAGAKVSLADGTQTATDVNGFYSFDALPTGAQTVVVTQPNYADQTLTTVVTPMQNMLNVSMTYDVQSEMYDEIMAALSESSFDDAEGESQYVSPLLISKGDVFNAAASYAFSPVRFRLRGYSQYMPYESTYINGVNFNEQERGRFNYSSLGGLNDASRNKESVNALESAYYAFGNVGNTTNINMRASQFAAGGKVGLAGTNRSYWLRATATYATGIMDNGWAVAASAAYRWSQEGRNEGTFYNSGAYFLSAEKIFNKHHSINIATYGAPTERANSSALTQETVDLTSIYYNPYWGWQDGKKRNSRIVHSFDPTLILNHDWKIDNTSNLRTGIAAHYSMYSNSALTFYNAPDPRPDYYRNLPSYQLGGWGLGFDGKFYNDFDFQASHGVVDLENGTWIGGNQSLIQTNTDAYSQLLNAWKNGYGTKGDNATQMNWEMFYDANARNNVTNPNGMAKYMLERRHNNSLEVALNSTYDKQVNDRLKVIAGLEAKYTKGIHYKTVDDLLGANQWIDIDPFSDRDIADLSENVSMSQAEIQSVRQNDMNNPNRVVKEGDVFGYKYDINVYKAALFAMNDWDFNRLKFNYALRLTYTSFNRYGYMKNGRADYLTNVLDTVVNSYGQGNTHHFVDPALKFGLSYSFNARNKIIVNALAETRAPLSNNYYISPRIYDRGIDELAFIKGYDRGNDLLNYYGLSEKILAYDLSYVASFPKVKARVTVFGTHSIDGIERIGYYNDEYRTFINHTMAGVDRLYLGAEAGASVTLSPHFTLSGVVSYTYGKYTDNAYGVETAENGMKIDGEQELADRILVKDLMATSGPQLAGMLKLNYFHPKMWFAELSVSAFGYNYLGISPTRFSQGILTGKRADGTAVRTWYGAGCTEAEKEAKIAALGSQEELFAGTEWYNHIMVDASVGKLIYLKGGKSININLTLNNLTNNTGVKTGGYQQARIPTVSYQETSYKVSNQVNKYPSKFYYAWGFNFFLNVGFRF